MTGIDEIDRTITAPKSALNQRHRRRQARVQRRAQILRDGSLLKRPLPNQIRYFWISQNTEHKQLSAASFAQYCSKASKNGEIAMTEQLREGQRSKWLPGVKDSPAERVHGHQIFISLWLLCEIDPADP